MPENSFFVLILRRANSEVPPDCSAPLPLSRAAVPKPVLKDILELAARHLRSMKNDRRGAGTGAAIGGLAWTATEAL